MGGLGIFALLGAAHQDRKLLALRGAPYASYLAQTSILPFGAVLAGRQRFALSELPWGALAVGLLVAVSLRQVHGHLFESGGAYVSGAAVAGAFFLALSGWLRDRRATAATAVAAGTGGEDPWTA